MRIKRRTAVEFRTWQVTTVHANREPTIAWCEQCMARVQMFTPDRAADLTSTKPRAIYRSIEKGEIHFIESSAGELFICRLSLAHLEDDLREGPLPDHSQPHRGEP